MKLKISIVQMDVKLADYETNFERMKTLLQQAVEDEVKPDLILLPEMWNGGYALEKVAAYADRNGERTKRFFYDFCRENDVFVHSGSIAESRDDGIYNTSYVFDRKGACIASYSKMHLFKLLEEEKYLKAGDRPVHVQIGEAKAGMLICYDLRFPELSRQMALSGVQMLFVPAQWPHPRLEHWRTLLKARAIENQLFVISCNAVGERNGLSFFGHSMVVDPWGEVIAEADSSEQILKATIDLDLVQEVRGRIPVFSDRRPELYG